MRLRGSMKGMSRRRMPSRTRTRVSPRCGGSHDSHHHRMPSRTRTRVSPLPDCLTLPGSVHAVAHAYEGILQP